MSEIVPGLYLAGLSEVIEEAENKALGVTHILNVASEINADRSEDYDYKHCGVGDDDESDDISKILDECAEYVRVGLADGGIVMVHCWSGVSRSAIVAMAFLVRHRCFSAADAYHRVLGKRPIVDPWPPYLCQYQQWAETWSHRRSDSSTLSRLVTSRTALPRSMP